jgi:type II secretory pathway component PulJ
MSMAMAQRLVQLGEEMERVENQLRKHCSGLFELFSHQYLEKFAPLPNFYYSI